MIKVDEKKIKINLFTYLILAIMLIVLLNDYITFIFNPSYIIGIVISFLAVSGILFGLRKKIKIDISLKKEDVIFYMFLLAIMVITIPYPDRAFDTFNYHLYLQENPFGDKIFYDFFAGKNLNSFSYAFPDRIFYLFRYFLGYRLGVIFNYLLLIGIFYNVKKVIKKLQPSISSLSISIVSLLITFSLSILDIVDSYYIDLVSLYLLIELFNLMIMGDRLTKNKEKNIKLFSIIGLLYGLTFATKISNAVILVLYFIIYILKNKNIFKMLTIKNVILTIITFTVPFALYFGYNVIETGNPVFPFYNTIFKSRFFGLWDWLDTRFGPHTLIETLLWPIYILKYPNRLVDTAICEPLWCFGYLISFMYIFYYGYNFFRKKEIDKTRLLYFISTVLVYFTWAKFQLGYARYGLIVLLLGGIATYIFITDMLKNKKYIFFTCILLLMMGNYSYSVIRYQGQGNFWIYNNYFNNKDDYKYNLDNLLSSGKNDISLKEFEDKSAWLIFYYNAGHAKIINDEMPIISATSGVDNDYTKEIYNDNISKYDHLYTLVDSLDFQNFITSLNDTQYKIKDVKKVITSSIIDSKSSFTYIFEVEKCKKNCNNSIAITNQNFNESIDVGYKLDAWVGVAKDLNNAYGNDFYVNVDGIKTLINKDGNLSKINVIDDIEINVDTNDYWYMIYKVSEER